jgi:hypothetical protein
MQSNLKIQLQDDAGGDIQCAGYIVNGHKLHPQNRRRSINKRLAPYPARVGK